MAESKSKAVVAGVFTLIGILLGAGLNFYFTIAAEREKDLREIRRKAYVDFLHAQVKWDSAQYATSEEESRQFSEDYREKTAEARKRIAVYGDKAVVEALAKYWRNHFDRKICPGTYEKIGDDVSIYQRMREDVMPGDELVNDEDMMMLLFLCQIPEKQTWIKKIFSGTK